jgi:N-acetylgalactosamine 4-sulfate 6-O-sulfotransferase
VVGGLLEGENVTGVAAGRYSTYAITASGALFSFGLDACSNAGAVPPLADAYLPRRITLPRAEGAGAEAAKVVAMSVGYVHWAALTSDGAVFTCDTGDDGYAGTLANARAPNADGELGREMSGSSSAHVPGQVTGVLAGKRVVAIAAGRSHTLAVDDQGRLYGWGNNQAGQLGVDAALGRTSNAPTLVTAPPLDTSAVSAVAAGEYFSLAALAGGGLLGWGANGNGQLGRSIDASPEERHVAAAHLGAAGQPPLHVMSLAAGYQHAAAVVAVAPKAGMSDGHGGALASSSPVTLVPASGSLDSIPGPSAPPADIWAAHRAALPARHGDIIAASPDVFAMLPTASPPLLPGIASPCWHAAAEALGAHTDVRCLPLIHVLGVSKCGTTDLYKRLAKHPDFVDSLNKGPHFWDESPPGPAGQFASYVALFDELARRVGANASDAASSASRLVSCDASSNTFTASGVYRRGHSPEGDVTVGELLLDAAPYGRFILMLRNPTDRLLSAFHYYRRMFGPKDQKPATAADFEAHVTESIGAWGTCLAGHGGNATPCIRRFEPQQLIKGMYSEFLWDWTPRLRPGARCFQPLPLICASSTHTRLSPPLHPSQPDQLLVLRLEDYSVDLRRHLDAVFKFTGLRQPSEAEWADILSAQAANVGAHRAVLEGTAPQRQKGHRMTAETRAMLDAFYAPFNRRLADALGDQRFTWA